MTAETYTDRHEETVEVRSFINGVVTWDNGWSYGGVPAEHHHLLKVRSKFVVETIRLTEVTGLRRARDTVWLWRKSDQDLAREHDEFMAERRRRRQQALDENRADWTRREAALPDPLRRRLERFRSNGGDAFDRDGWGYELKVCELAVLYVESGHQESDAIRAYAAREGTSGNQHSFANALSCGLVGPEEDREIVATRSVSALSPITGDADYSKADQ